MKFVADLHLHSHYSRATSKNLNFEHLSKWAQLKGVHVVGTGDIAHPGWLQEMKDKLEPAEEGLFRLKDAYAKEIQSEVPSSCQAMVRFMLAGEISRPRCEPKSSPQSTRSIRPSAASRIRSM